MHPSQSDCRTAMWRRSRAAELRLLPVLSTGALRNKVFPEPVWDVPLSFFQIPVRSIPCGGPLHKHCATGDEAKFDMLKHRVSCSRRVRVQTFPCEFARTARTDPVGIADYGQTAREICRPYGREHFL